MMDTDTAGFTVLLAILISIPIYFIPTIVAIKRSHKYVTPIVLLNLIGGFTVIGWVAALVWAFVSPEEGKQAAAVGSAQEIESLYALKEKGILSPEEFESRKKKLLG